MIAQPRTVSRGMSIPRLDAEQAEREAAPFWIKEIFGVPRPDHDDRATVRPFYCPTGWVGIEAELVSPASGLGRTVYVVIPPEQVLAVLKLCREAAAEIRSEPMGGTETVVPAPETPALPHSLEGNQAP